MNSQTNTVSIGKIRLIALDVDGVLTDGTLLYGAGGQELKGFNTQDGLGLTAARKQVLSIAIITGRTSAIVEWRAHELQVDYLYMGCRNKTVALQDICQRMGIGLEQVAYMGDDLNDLGPLTIVGLAMAPHNACDDVKSIAHLVTATSGGHGAVREAVEYILKGQGSWSAVLASYREEDYERGQ